MRRFGACLVALLGSVAANAHAESNPLSACATLLLPTSASVPKNTPAFYAERTTESATTTDLLRNGSTAPFALGGDNIVWPADALVENASYELSVMGASCTRSAALFTVGPARPLPTEAGTLEALPQTFEELARGTPYRHWAAQRKVVFTASADLTPFLGTTLKWFVLDGIRQYSEPAERGWSLLVWAPCTTPPSSIFPPGHHTVAVHVDLIGGPKFDLPAIDADLDCTSAPPLPPLPADASADASGNGSGSKPSGCAAGTSGDKSQALVIALVLLVGVTRATARRRRTKST